MQIGKKVILIIFGFCIPILVVTCLAGVSWLHDEIDTIRGYVIDNEIKRIAATIEHDLSLFELSTDIVKQNRLATSAVKMPADELNISKPLSKVKLFDRYFPDTYVLTLINGKVEQDPTRKAHFSLPDHLYTKLSLQAEKEGGDHSGKQVNTRLGVYYEPKFNQAYFVYIEPLSTERATMYVSPITASYLHDLGDVTFASDLQVMPGNASPGIQLSGDTLVVQLNIPAVSQQSQSHLSVSFSNQLFSHMVQQYSLLTIGILALVILLNVALFFWVRLDFVRPFNRLARQFNDFGPKGTEPFLLQHGGHRELDQLTSNINRVLSGLYSQENQSRITLESIAEAVILTDINGRISYINPYSEQLFGCTPSQVSGIHLSSLIGEHIALTDTFKAFVLDPSLSSQQLLLNLQLEQPKQIRCTLSHFTDLSDAVVGVVLVLRDNTEEAQLKRQIQRNLLFDSVSGLLNRSAFEAKLEHYQQGSNLVAVAHLDLEQFKLINDSCGHRAGDVMLKKVANAILSCLSEQELLGRLGGDQFGLLIKQTSALESARLIKRIIASVNAQVITHGDTRYGVGVSIGVAIAAANTQPRILELLKDADIACAAAKRKGSNQVYFYDARDKDLSSQRNAPKWAVRIAQALENDEIVLYYQKIKRLSSPSERQRLEVLLRIRESGERVLPPTQFIAAAERFKLIVEVDKHVIKKTFSWLSLHKALWEDHCLSINLSGSSLGAEGMVDFILSQQKHFGVPSSSICFEITETSAIQNHSRAMKMLLDLRKRGFAFALDDFGSGFASYGYLKEMPVDYVKIDGCFIRNLASNAKDYAIVKSVNDVCRVMGIETVAEFVENQEIIDKLMVIGVNYAQGYAIGRPQPLDAYQPLLIPEALTA